MEDFMGPAAAALVGLLAGIPLGLAARLGRFCTLGAIEDQAYGNDAGRAWMWASALGAAILGTGLLDLAGIVDVGTTAYRTVPWNPVASVLGGLVFGYGMAMAGNCGFGALARLGGGELRSFVIVVVIGLSALIVLSGPLAHLRLLAFPPDRGLHLTGLPAWCALPIGTALWLVGLWRAPRRAVWGTVAGLSIAAAWGGTSWLSQASFEAIRPASHTFSAPIGGFLLWLMTASGNAPGFGTGSVAGVLVGALAGSVGRGQFRWEACEDPRELGRQIGGAALMGAGAVVALGCSIGQGLSAFAVLAFSAPVTLAAIVIGARLGLRQLIEGRPPYALRGALD